MASSPDPTPTHTADDRTADPQVERALQRLRAADPQAAAWLDDPDHAKALSRLALASDFAIQTLQRQPGLLGRLAESDDPVPIEPPVLAADNQGQWPALLRRYRAAEAARMVWRDVQGLDDIEATLAASSRLAETCLQLALEALEADFAGRHGVVRDKDGTAQQLVVFALGKLGGGELNFSSDVDLVYGYESPGESDGERALDAERYFSRLGQQLAKLLDEVTADGFCHRVDLRLRPYGKSGRVAWSFPGMEQYFQREGRDWERYAWQKARPVAGDIAAGERFLETLRPFVYRRYLDFGALDGLREMKATIAAEVARKELADDVKRGPGGIREIEFLVQALQLIRGGREPELRGGRLLVALDALVEAHQIEPGVGDALRESYRFLRHLENRLQMLRDEQTHALPEGMEGRSRVARGLGYAEWAPLQAELDRHRARVAEEFDAFLAPREHQPVPGALASYWRALPDEGKSEVLAEAGFGEPASADALLRDLARSPGVRGLSDSTRARLDRVLPALLHGAADSSQTMLALRRLVALLHNILRRSAYLALLDEQPEALARLVEVVSHSALLAERLASYPLLLDELLDARISGPLPDRDELIAACMAVAGEVDDTEPDDPEAILNALNEVRQALSFRIAMAHRDRRQAAVESARQLAGLADGVVRRVLALAEREVGAAHGRVPDARFAVLGYGSLGGEELGFGSDLDLVFLYDAPAESRSDGERPLDASRWFARLAQKLVALLDTPSAAGRLFEVDVRLRPDGAKGLLVSTLASFSEYQRQRAWNWEHQALVRVRCIAGDRALCADFNRIRAQVLGRQRGQSQVHGDVLKMRRRMRAELDRSNFDLFDLKQGEGALVDLEFLLQALVLREAHSQAALLEPRDSPGLVSALQDVGVIEASTAEMLLDAHANLLSRGLDCSLDRRQRLVPYGEGIEAARAVIRDAARKQGLDFTTLDNGTPDAGGATLTDR